MPAVVRIAVTDPSHPRTDELLTTLARRLELFEADVTPVADDHATVRLSGLEDAATGRRLVRRLLDYMADDWRSYLEL